MPLESLPDAVIARLRAQCSAFANRVAGTAAEARASEQTELPVPHAFYMPAGIERGEGEEISGLGQHLAVRFRVMIAVDNRSDDRGQAGAGALMARTADVIQALVGWQPDATWAPVLFEGLEDSFDSNRHTLWGELLFSTSIVHSDL
jgi:hypothetical protein